MTSSTKHSNRASKLAHPAPALAGRRVLITRAEEQAQALRVLLESRGAEVVELPFIEIRPPRSWDEFDASLRSIMDYDWLILTSVNGVHAFFARLDRLGMSADDLQHLKIAAIGPATAEAIEKHGLIVDLVPPRYVAEEVVRALRPQITTERLLLVRAKIARDVIPQELSAAGAVVDVREAYETVLPEASQSKLLKLLSDRRRRPDVITFTSSSTVENMLKMSLGTEIPSLLAGVKFAVIGPVTANTLRSYGLPVHIEAEEYTMAGLARAIEMHYAAS